MKTSSSRFDVAWTWQVQLHPHNPTLVTFTAYLDGLLQARHQARWLGPARGWDPQLWQPRTPPVPKAVLQSLEQLLSSP